MKNAAQHKQNIEIRLTELWARLEKVEAALDEPADPDLEDQAIELEDDEVLESVGRAGQLEMRQLEDALKRIANGTYGDCAKCGKEISEARLEAVPYTLLCRTCANSAAS
ncbi:TraR/DksA family transcriptional regulator [Sulfitobacter sp.]|uniref:TraR/DksA family transcriptional regulator n=1 Tax=Sulfitobacter sp. TaxID=1903071 RepID=UPI0030018F0D